VFEYWDDDFTAASRRVIDPPTPVFVELATAIPTLGAFRRDRVSLRIKAGALDLTGKVPGLLLAWAQCTDSSWVALVEFAVPTANGRGRIPTRPWTPAHALSQRRE
jgi:hypothetical protein